MNNKDFLVYDDGNFEVIHHQFAPNNNWLFMYKLPRSLGDKPISQKKVAYDEDCSDEEYEILFDDARCMTLVGTDFEELSISDFTNILISKLWENSSNGND